MGWLRRVSVLYRYERFVERSIWMLKIYHNQNIKFWLANSFLHANSRCVFSLSLPLPLHRMVIIGVVRLLHIYISGHCGNEPLYTYSNIKQHIHITIHNLLFNMDLVGLQFFFFIDRCCVPLFIFYYFIFALMHVCVWFFSFLPWLFRFWHEFSLSKMHWPMRIIIIFVCVCIFTSEK